jgi:DNA-binding response OmpR family regulator
MHQYKIRVCLIDDDPSFCEIYSIALRKAGFVVSMAHNGDDGLELVRLEMPDIILLDLNMPRKNGFEVLRELSADPSASKIPVIVLSNNDRDEAIREVGDFKADFFLVKVLTSPKEVTDIIREVMLN